MSPDVLLHPPAAITDSLQRLRRTAGDRAALTRPFAAVSRHLAAWSPAEQQDWAAASLALLAVNAGPPCLIAFWDACRTVPLPRRLLLDAAHASAQLCRHAGARAAIASLHALPVVARRAAEPTDFATWWRALHRLAREAPSQLEPLLAQSERLLGAQDAAWLEDFVATGLKATARDRRRRAAFFRLEDPLAQSLLARPAGAAGFDALSPRLTAYAEALWGAKLRLQAVPLPPGNPRRPAINAGIVVLPDFVATSPPGRTADWYRAAAAHAGAHLAAPRVQHEIGQLKPLALAMIGLIEDARVEALALRRLPGLRRLWASFHDATPDSPHHAAALMARLGRALIDPGYTDPNSFVVKGRCLFADAGASLDDPMLSRRLGGLLGNELGQMRAQFNARTYATEPSYRDDNLHLWRLPEAPDNAIALAIEAARPTGDTSPANPTPDDAAPPQQTGRARTAAAAEPGALLARYPEWDAAAQRERPDWTSLREAETLPGDAAALTRNLEAEPALRSAITRLVHANPVGRAQRLRRQPDGEELDLDAAIDAAIALRSAATPDDRIHRATRTLTRSLATTIVLDVSFSTRATAPDGRSVLDIQRLAVAALAEALQARGERFALRAFASNGRDDVRMARIKDFDEPNSPAVHARLAGLQPGYSSRLGAALRHAGAELRHIPALRHLLLVLTDGEPSDIDVAHSAELVEDARRAVQGLRTGGLDVFALVLDPAGHGSGQAIFGRNCLPVTRLEGLPAQLAALYFRLAQR